LLKWVHLLGTKGTVEADAEGIGVHHGDEEGFHILPRQSPPSSINDGPRNKERQSLETAVIEEFVIGKHSCPGV